MQSATLEGVINVSGPLANAFSQLQPDTICDAKQLMSERRTNKKLRDDFFWTNNSSLYDLENEIGVRDIKNGEAVVYFGKGNLIFDDIERATQQLINTGNYRPANEKAESFKKAGTTLRVKLSELNLQGNDNQWRYFEINTKNYDSLNSTQRTFAERVYGEGEEFKLNMEMLSKSGKSNTRIYVLTPDYVKSNATESAIARACWLGSFDGVSRFLADGRVGGGPGVALRGVRLKNAEGAQKFEESPVDYESVFEQARLKPLEAVEYLNEQRARGLLNIVHLLVRGL